MLKPILTGIAAAAMMLGLLAADSEKIVVPLKGIVILSPGFKAEDINITDRNIITAEPIANNQIRVTGLAVGIEFMIDRTDTSRILLYVVFIILVAVPAFLGFRLLKEDRA